VGYFLDACALIAFANEEEGADRVEAVLASEECAVHPVNVYELYKDAKKRTGSFDAADELLSGLMASGLTVADGDTLDALRGAADYKLRFGRIAIPDVIGLAACKARGHTFLTSDHAEFDALQRAGEPIEFFRGPLGS